FLAEMLRGLQREDCDRAAIRHRPLRAQQTQCMAVTNDSVELLQQSRIGDWQHLARRCFYIEGEVVRIGGNRIEERRDLLCLCHVGWLCSLPWIAKMRPIQEQVVSFSPGQVRKSDRCSRAFKGKEAI